MWPKVTGEYRLRNILTYSRSGLIYMSNKFHKLLSWQNIIEDNIVFIWNYHYHHFRTLIIDHATLENVKFVIKFCVLKDFQYMVLAV